MSRPIFIVVAISLLTSSFSRAGEMKAPVVYDAVETGGLHSSYQLDSWIVQMNVGYTNLPLGIDQSLFIGFDDILSNADWLIPMSADFRVDRIGFMPSVLAVKMSGGSARPEGGLFNQLTFDMKLGLFNLPLYYRLVDEEDLSFDVLAGARYLGLNLGVGLTGGPLGNRLGAVSAGTSADILDGIIGVRIKQEFNEAWFYTLYGDIGKGSSDLTWQVQGDLGYRVRDDFSVSLGYRYLSYAESSPANAVDLSASGPQLTLRWDF